MRRGLLGAFLVVLAAGVVTGGECPLEVGAGWHHLILTTHYKHLYPVDGEMTWSHSVGEWFEGPGVATASSAGAPIGHQWVMDMMLAGECGEKPNPNLIFTDGFESGGTDEWQ